MSYIHNGYIREIFHKIICTATYFCFQLRELADGKIVLVLEGGFNLDVLTEASEQCARALLGLPIEKVCILYSPSQGTGSRDRAVSVS